MSLRYKDDLPNKRIAKWPIRRIYDSFNGRLVILIQYFKRNYLLFHESIKDLKLLNKYILLKSALYLHTEFLAIRPFVSYAFGELGFTG